VKLSQTAFYLLATIFLTNLGLSNASAHSVFKKIMDQKYQGIKINCNACHIEGEDKTERNLFGKLFYRELESENLTQTWKDKKGKEKRDYEQEVMTPAFEKAWAKVAAMTYDDMVKSGLVEGMEKKDETSAVNPANLNSFLFVSLIASRQTENGEFQSPKLDSIIRKRLLTTFRRKTESRTILASLN